jgi:hypothetical protein
MKKFAIIVGLYLLAAGLVLAQSGPRLAEMRSSRGVDPKTQAPVNVSETFTTNAGPVYLTVKLIEGIPGTKVRFVVNAADDGGRQIAAYEFPDVHGTGYLSFKVNPPASGWPVGRYQASFYLNGKLQGSIGFSVVGSASAGGSQGSYRTFSSPSHGFSVEVPANWVEGGKNAPSVACMFLSNPDNDPIASLNVQVVPIQNGSEGQARQAINLVARQLIDQITKSPGGKIRGDTWVTAGTKSGRELDSEYAYNGRSIRQRQFLTYHASRVFIVILTVETNLYASYSPHYLQMTKSLAFSR